MRSAKSGKSVKSIDVHGLGLFFPNFFDDESQFFEKIQSEHNFQNLTESNKPNSAYRTGLYITDVQEGKFHLLRCSSNFTGPTEGLCHTDRLILNELNEIATNYFPDSAQLNHVLAQIYNNSSSCKASIKSHSDKTKDMPQNGLMAFCTFYKNDWHPKVRPSKSDPLDMCYKEKSVLTTLRFRLKDDVKNLDLPQEFSIKLYPNSVFLMPLTTNRMYTHEIKPSILPFDYLPTRMGYVVRCSKTLACFIENQTFVKSSDGSITKLVRPTVTDLDKLRRQYFVENTTSQIVDYGDVFFSMNEGDYMEPQTKN